MSSCPLPCWALAPIRIFMSPAKAATAYVGNVLKFLQQYQSEFQRTEALCRKLKELNLLEPMQAQINLGSGERMALAGFSVVNRARLKTSADVLAQLVKSDYKAAWADFWFIGRVGAMNV